MLLARTRVSLRPPPAHMHSPLMQARTTLAHTHARVHNSPPPPLRPTRHTSQVEQEARELALRQEREREELGRRARRKERYAALVKEMYMPEPDDDKVAELQERVYRLQHPVGDRRAPHMPDYGERLNARMHREQHGDGSMDGESQEYAEPLARKAQKSARSAKSNISPDRRGADGKPCVFVAR